MDVDFYLSDVHVGDFGLVSEEVNHLIMCYESPQRTIFRALQCRGLSYVDVKEAITLT